MSASTSTAEIIRNNYRHGSGTPSERVAYLAAEFNLRIREVDAIIDTRTEDILKAA